MAVQAQYPSSVLLKRNVQEGKNVLGNNDFSLQPQPGGGGGGGFLDQSHMIFNNNGVGGNPRKRSREIAATQATTTTGVNMNSFSFSLQNHHQQQQQQRHQQNQNQNHQLIDLSLLQNQPNLVSTGLRLSFAEQSQQHLQQQQQQPQQIQQQIQQHPVLLSLLSEDLSFQLKQQSDELSYFLQAQANQLRGTLAEKRRRHYRALLGAAEEAVARTIREKDAEVEQAARRSAELEAQWAQLSAEAQSWRAKAQAQEAQAAVLQAQIQQANANVMAGGALQQDTEGVGQSCAGGGDAEDSESAYVDPVSGRLVNSLSCKVCRKRVASVVLLPCRHLCVCTDCDGVVSACPQCLSLRNASVEVFLT